MNLSSNNVTKTFMDCLFKNDEDKTNHVKVEGIVSIFGFYPERLQSHYEDIKSMLSELPIDFRTTHGGGMSFLEACNDCNGIQWTGEHQVMEQLFVMAIGLDLAKYCSPKETWQVFPGGVPYIAIQEAAVAEASTTDATYIPYALYSSTTRSNRRSARTICHKNISS